MFKNLKIRVKLLVAFGIVLLLTALLSVYSILQLRKASDNLTGFVNGSVAADDAVKACRIATFIAAKDMRDMVIAGTVDSDNLQVIQENEESIRTNLQKIKELGILDKEQVGELEASLTEWMGIAEEIITQLKSGDAMGAAEKVRTECTPLLDTVISEINALNTETVNIRAATVEDSVKITNMSMIILLVITVIAIILAMFICAVVTRLIVYPVKQVEAAMQGLAKGHMSQELDYDSADEFGSLVGSVKETCEVLANVVTDLSRLLDDMSSGNFDLYANDEHYRGDFEPLLAAIRRMNRSLSSTMRQINDASDQVASGADQVSSGAQALSQGATEQASSVEELAATINDISREVNNTAENAREASEKVMEAQTKLSTSNEQMQDMIAAMGEISQKSGDIGKIIKTIEDIAFQTNILALNAAVEAARAGAAGKGFAVVADEVRNLASKSAEASKNTAQLIEATVQSVQEGTGIANRTAESLDRIVLSSEESAKLVQDISKASQDQAASIAQVTQGIDQISSVVHTNSATSEESAAASQELSSQAQILMNLVKQFRIREA